MSGTQSAGGDEKGRERLSPVRATSFGAPCISTAGVARQRERSKGKCIVFDRGRSSIARGTPAGQGVRGIQGKRTSRRPTEERAAIGLKGNPPAALVEDEGVSTSVFDSSDDLRDTWRLDRSDRPRRGAPDLASLRGGADIAAWEAEARCIAMVMIRVGEIRTRGARQGNCLRRGNVEGRMRAGRQASCSTLQ